jgi:hypothetical protein
MEPSERLQTDELHSAGQNQLRLGSELFAAHASLFIEVNESLPMYFFDPGLPL